MNLFLKYNKGYIIIYLLSLSLTIIYCNVMDFIGFGEVIYILIFNTFILLCFLAFRYYKNRQLYKLLKNGLIRLNDAFLELGSSDLSGNISELLKKQHNLYEAEIQKCNKVHNEHLTFINQWVHQMKTPLSVIQLQLQEYAGEEKARSMEEEVNKLNKGLDMAMHFARIDSFQNDFIVERIFLKKLVIGTINEEKKLFIKNKITPRLEIDDAIEVYSDVKWIKFVLDQLIINGVKYSKGTGKELIIKAFEKEKEILLSVIDEGIGIPRKDIKRVFDLFFTGENGRKYGESTGMGLYISKEVCVNLGHKIEITSTADKGTMVTIRFKI
ncbi:sensor histidine kinase [Clostridium estertheticum]|uniref:sensor histidine kinase n=1 Tax=Clostridium estertheticum TaxID=238834 RepID=UPI001CF28FCB|nr:sensor histidine kinase [Clostridium estertheticum]MCB2307154.1 sensor histidine kinase [Clostridium estertheticum]MCB2344082.1 sensor histidine kinase [Clostridium estertheticum]MCB2348304.1 sensor histidine kinase [Clostridium estertheticum]WAG45935.1 sensor histidine kinase [Clostridium estertheticum]